MHTFISPHGPCRMTVIEFDLELELELRLDDGDGERDDDDDDYHKARQDQTFQSISVHALSLRLLAILE